MMSSKNDGMIRDTLVGMRKSSMPEGVIFSAVPNSMKAPTPSLMKVPESEQSKSSYTLGVGAPFPGLMSFDGKSSKKSKKSSK